MKAKFYLNRTIPLMLTCLIFIWGCRSSDKGSLTFRLVWPTPARQLESLKAGKLESRHPAFISPQADYLQVTTIRASLWDENGTGQVVLYEHAFDDHRGEMTAPVGKYQLRLEGLNPSGVVRYRGERSPVEIKKNTETALGDIYMEDLGIPILEPPTAPSDLQASVISSSSVGLNWTDNSGNENGFVIERRYEATGIYVVIFTAGPDVTRYYDQGLDCGVNYYYLVSAFNDAGKSASANEVLITTPSCPHLPSAPSGLYAESVTAAGIDLGWIDNSDNEDGFIIERKLGESGSYNEVVTTAVGEIAYQDSRLKCKTTYYYKIHAFNELGDSEYSNEISATTDVCWRAAQVDAGGLFTCAVTDQKGIKCWGDNQYGELGDNSTIDNYTPVDVSGLTSGMEAVSAGDLHACALTDAGGIKCWGYNRYGELGDNSTIDKYAPVDVSGLASGIKAVSAGGLHTCALTDAGGVKCWGINNQGQLGDNSTIDKYSPVEVVGLNSGVKAVAAGYDFTCALTEGGGIKCWGDRRWLGDGSYSSVCMTVPVDVKGLNSGVIAISTGRFHSCALTAEGSVKCWGNGQNGQLGTGYHESATVPVQVAGLNSGIVAISAGGVHTCALTGEGKVKCWGYNGFGELGDGTVVERSSPVDVIGLDSVIIGLSAGQNHVCAMTDQKEVECWGSNNDRELGNYTVTYYSATPVYVIQESP